MANKKSQEEFLERQRKRLKTKIEDLLEAKKEGFKASTIKDLEEDLEKQKKMVKKEEEELAIINKSLKEQGLLKTAKKKMVKKEEEEKETKEEKKARIAKQKQSKTLKAADKGIRPLNEDEINDLVEEIYEKFVEDNFDFIGRPIPFKSEKKITKIILKKVKTNTIATFKDNAKPGEKDFKLLQSYTPTESDIETFLKIIDEDLKRKKKLKKITKEENTLNNLRKQKTLTYDDKLKLLTTRRLLLKKIGEKEKKQNKMKSIKKIKDALEKYKTAKTSYVKIFDKKKTQFNKMKFTDKKKAKKIFDSIFDFNNLMNQYLLKVDIAVDKAREKEQMTDRKIFVLARGSIVTAFLTNQLFPKEINKIVRGLATITKSMKIKDIIKKNMKKNEIIFNKDVINISKNLKINISNKEIFCKTGENKKTAFCKTGTKNKVLVKRANKIIKEAKTNITTIRKK